MPRPKFPWISKRTKTMPELPYEPPIWMGPHSNGEYFMPQSPYERKLRKFILRKADENARRVGMDRREFMASAMGMTTTLWCIQFASGCSSDSESDGGGGSAGFVINPPGGGGGVGPAGAGGVVSGGAGGSSGAPPGGAGGTPPIGGAGGSGGSGACVEEAMYDEQAACAVVGGNEFIFDVQTHWFSQADTVRFPPNILQLFGVLFLAANEDSYVNEIFLNSDTTMTVLTSWPGSTCSPDPANTDPCGLPLSNQSMADSRDRINALACNTQRVVQHVQVLPNDGLGLQMQLDIMTQMHCERRAHGWKMYPGFASNSIDPRGSTGYFLDEPNARAVIEHGLSLGIQRFSVHKGLQIGNFFEVEHNHPRDVGVVAAAYPNAQFIIYHSAIDAGLPSQAPPEGPYDPSEPNPTSVNALIRSLQDNGIQPGQNVYAEIGTTIDRLMTNPTAAAHFFGKLMLYVGVDNIVWGTDCVIGGSPQGRIEWFRTLTIPDSMQQQYGYAPLDATAKAKIFGLNAARLYGIDTDAMRCHVNSCGMADLKRHFDEEYGGRRWMFQTPGGPKTWEEYVEHSERARKLGRPG